MNKPAEAALERLEGIAAEFLENNIAQLERAQGVKVKDVEVVLIPDRPGTSPAVSVTVSTTDA